MKNGGLFIFALFFSLPVFAESRSFDEIFPSLAPEARKAAFSGGYIKAAEKPDIAKLIGSSADGLDPQITAAVLSKKPGIVTEQLVVLPISAGLLDIYNALANVRGLKGRLYHSHSKNRDVPLFEDATRLESAKKAAPVPDPKPAQKVPQSETVYIRLKDVNFGNTFYRGEMKKSLSGISYCLTNNKDLSYLFVPVIKEEKFTAQFYFEPLTEGILIYSIAGADVSHFAASKIDMPSAIGKRLAVIISWVAEGIGKAAGK